MTLILKLDLDMVKMYLHTKNEVSLLRGPKVIAWTDRNTDTQTDTQTDMTENITYPHTRVVMIADINSQETLLTRAHTWRNFYISLVSSGDKFLSITKN